MRKELIAPSFYFGTLASSIGSFTFNLSLIAFMLKSGFHLGHATLILGLQRFVPVLVTAFWGHWSDRLSAKMVVAIAEAIAAASSVALLFIWSGASSNYLALAFLCVTRATVVAFQTGSRVKITKLLSDDTFLENAKHAIWLNKATQGATLFGGLAAWIVIRYFTFETAIVIDGLTFLLNGAIAFAIPEMKEEKEGLVADVVTWHQKFRDLFRFNRDAALLDIVLAVSMMGTVAFMARMAGDNQSWAGLYMAGFGLAVWVAGFLEQGVTNKSRTAPFWLIMAICFFTLGKLHDPSIVVLTVMFIKDLSYWIILHRISSHIQTDTPASYIGGVSSARASLMIAILATGEIMVGAWAGIVPLEIEGSLRAAVGIGVGAFLLLASARKVVVDERPAL